MVSLSRDCRGKIEALLCRDSGRRPSQCEAFGIDVENLDHRSIESNFPQIASEMSPVLLGVVAIA